MNILFLNEHRCKCGKLLLKGVFFDGSLEIKCKRCGDINTIGNAKTINDATRYLLIVNKDGIVVNGSDSACYILGYSREEIIGKSFAQINPTMPKKIEERFFGNRSTLDEENYLKIDTFHHSKSGKKIPVVVLLKLYRPVVEEKYLLIIAEPKNTESKSNFLKNDTLEFPENACDFYFDVDKNGVSEYISPSTKIIFGFSQEDVVGKSYFNYLPLEIRKGAEEMFQHFSINGQPYRAVHDIKIAENNDKISSELYFTPKFNDAGKFVGYRALGWVIKPKSENLEA